MRFLFPRLECLNLKLNLESRTLRTSPEDLDRFLATFILISTEDDDQRRTDKFQRDMGSFNVLATELVREVMGYLQGEELPLALTNTRLLRIARSINEDRTLSAQRKSAYLSSGALTTFVLDHGMVEVNAELMNLTAKYGCLESVKILRAHDPPCPWDVWTCMYAAEGGHLDVLQWARSQDPPCPF